MPILLILAMYAFGSHLWLAPLCIVVILAVSVIVAHRRVKKRHEEKAAKQARAEAAAQLKAQCETKRAVNQPAAKSKTATPKRKPGKSRKNPAPATLPQQPESVPAPVPVEASKPETTRLAVFHGNNAFAGQTVAFTGKLKSMTRAEAIKAVQDNGGRAFETMPAGTTLLVVGQNPGMNKMDKADEWIGQVRKITEAQFNAMLSQPLTCTPNEFAAAFAA